MSVSRMRKIAAAGAIPVVLAVVGGGTVWAEDGLSGISPEENKGSELSPEGEAAAEEPAVEADVAAEAESGTVVLAASSAPLILGPAPLTAEQQQFVDNGALAGTAVGAGGGAAAAGAPAAAIGALAGGAIGTAVAGPVGTIPGAVIGGVAAGAIAGAIGASYGSEVGSDVGADLAEDQVRSENGETPAESGSFGDTIAGIPLLAP